MTNEAFSSQGLEKLSLGAREPRCPELVRRMPPLNSLRAFEAAARHLSFVKAADELNVTPAAVSHQVKALEDLLGVSLFRRFSRGLGLTDEGRAYFPGLSAGFDSLAQATERLQMRGLAGTVRVSVIPSFSLRWLVPRLAGFRSRYPDIDVVVLSDPETVDFTRQDVDVGIRYGRGLYPGLRTDLLMREELFPVCSPVLINGARPLRALDDLRHHVLLHDFEHGHGDDWLGWAPWLAEAGLDDIDPERGLFFSDAAQITAAAVDGHGVAVGRSALLGDDLRAGRLVRPFSVARKETTPTTWSARRRSPTGRGLPLSATGCLRSLSATRWRCEAKVRWSERRNHCPAGPLRAKLSMRKDHNRKANEE